MLGISGDRPLTAVVWSLFKVRGQHVPVPLAKRFLRTDAHAVRMECGRSARPLGTAHPTMC